jgi:hypothetical protein
VAERRVARRRIAQGIVFGEGEQARDFESA